jgi:periplasmic mercuric ion binding protein
MKHKLILALALGGVALTVAAADKTTVTANATNRFTISGMHCDGCAGGLTAELKETRGIAHATVTFSNKLAVVAYDTNQVSATQLTKVIKDAGFEATITKP